MAAASPEVQTAGKLTVEVIDRKRQDYRDGTWGRYDLLYQGGEAIQKAASQFLVQNPLETQDWYKKRLDRFTYKNLVGSIVDDFLATIFQAPLEMQLEKPDKGDRPNVPDFYADELFKDPSGHGQDGTGDLNECAKALLRTALIKREAWVMVTRGSGAPGQEFTNRAAQEAAGDLRSTIHVLQPETVINARWDEHGLAWVILRERICTEEPLQKKPETETIQWQLVTRKTVRQFAIDVKPGENPKPDDEVREVGSKFRHHLADFEKIGQVPLMRLRMDDSLWMLDKLASVACQELRKRNELDWYEFIAASPQLVHKGEDALKQEAQDKGLAGGNRKRGAQYVWEIGKDSELEWLELSCMALEHLAKQLEALESDLYKATVQMALAQGQDASVVARSGISKARDAVAKTILCAAYAALVRHFVVGAVGMASIIRGDKDLDWEANGLDQHDTTDISVVAQGILTAQAIVVNSNTYKHEFEKLVARMILRGIDQATQDTIENEIDAYEYPDPLKDDEPLPPDSGGGLPDPSSKPTPKPKPTEGSQNG